MTTHLVFVYGSLKKGFHNNDHFLGETSRATYVGQATTLEPYLMLSGSAFPFLIDPSSLAHKTDLDGIIGRTRGEVYDVNTRTLRKLDNLEGHPTFYKREAVPVRVSDEARQLTMTRDAWVYFLQGAPPPCPVVMPDEAGFVEWAQERGGVVGVETPVEEEE